MIRMKFQTFQVKIPETGMLEIPREILKGFAGRVAKIVIVEVEHTKPSGRFRSLRGKYKGSLSTTDEFAARKTAEKKLEI